MLILAAVLSLTSCDGGPQEVLPATDAPAAGATRPASSTPAPTLTSTATPVPTATLTPSATPSPTATPTPTVTPTPLHPLSIELMRQQRYPGSEIAIEETLTPGSTYNRYVVAYESEGLTIYGLLTVPQGERPASGWPVIVFNHGYIPPDQYRTTERYGAYQDAFARNGYITLKPDYRGHGRSEGGSSGSSRRPGYTIDVLNAVASLQRYPDADPARVGMWGHSLGGEITLRAMVIVDDIKAGVVWGGMVGSFEEMYEARPGWMSDGLLGHGAVGERPEFWASIDPIAYLDELSGPVQIHHATGDTSVPVVWSEDFYTRLQAAGQTAELYIYQGDNHNISANFATAAQRSVAFFDEYVKGE